MIKLGDRITVKPATFDVPGKDGKPKAIPGTVVYVHPGGRYCVLEFDVGRREPVTIRESFQRPSQGIRRAHRKRREQIRGSTRRRPCVGRSVDGNRPGVRVYRTRRGYAGGR